MPQILPGKIRSGSCTPGAPLQDGVCDTRAPGSGSAAAGLHRHRTAPYPPGSFSAGVRRLPEISVLRYELDSSGKRSVGGGETVFLFIEPADPLVEAARLAGEREIPLHCIDVDVEGYPCYEEPFPDSYAVRRIGLASYYGEYRKVFGDSLPGREDLLREKGMAFRLQQLSARYERILLICGMAHLERLKEYVARPQAAPLERVKRSGISLYNLHPESCREVLAEYLSSHPSTSCIGVRFRRNHPRQAPLSGRAGMPSN